jgi:hypothetical protein
MLDTPNVRPKLMACSNTSAFSRCLPAKTDNSILQGWISKPLCGEIQAERLGPETPAFLLLCVLKNKRKLAGWRQFIHFLCIQ